MEIIVRYILCTTCTSFNFFYQPFRCFLASSSRTMQFSRNCLVNGAPGIAVFSRAVARTELLKPSTRLCTAYRPIDGINLHNVYMRKCMFHNALRYCCYLYPMISKETGRIHAAFVRDAIKILDRIFVVR